MRDLVLQMGISIDGYVSGGPEHDIGGGGPQHPDVVARTMACVSQAGLHAMGRVTYQEMSSFWPTSTDEYAKPMNEIPKVVFSKSLTAADWPTTTDLVDEYRLVTRPVALGSGERMFKDLPVERRLTLVEATGYPDGTVISIYRRAPRA